MTTSEVTDSGKPTSCCSAGLAKLWIALSAQVDQKKNEKQSHTDGSRMNAIGCSAVAPVPAGAVERAPCAEAVPPWRSSMPSRCHHRIAITTSAHSDAQAVASRHEPKSAVSPVRNRGAAAQPRLPVSPWTLNACPSRGAETRRLRMVKSAGWNGQLPSPASAAASISPP